MRQWADGRCRHFRAAEAQALWQDAGMEDNKVRPRLEDVYKLSGIPTYTFVAPEEYGRLKVALRTAGRGVVIEGPSGIGKTTAVTRALADIDVDDEPLMLSARRSGDRELIAELPDMKASGLVVIDDFHRLDDDTRQSVADYLKLLADEEDTTTKIVVVGINRAGESLINFARDLTVRLDVIKFESNSQERVEKLVREGAQALNVSMPVVPIAKRAAGSFHLAQLLCHSMCVASDILEYSETTAGVSKNLDVVVEQVIDDLAMSFMERAMKFAAGPNFSREGRAPYLQMLRWLAESPTWTVSIDRELLKHEDVRTSVTAVLSGGHLEKFLNSHEDLADLIHYDPRTHVLAVEDPKFYFFIRNLPWAKFAERVGYLNTGYTSKYDFALSFAGSDRAYAKAIYDELVSREFAVFYDHNEQARILATDVEEYLAPIYRSEASFVLCILGSDYPNRVWTRFESAQFRCRFGVESVIPVWFKDQGPSAFDETQKIGGFFLDRSEPLSPQVEYLGTLLQSKLTDYRTMPKTKIGADEFVCRQCRLVHNQSQLQPGRVALCIECAEKFKVG